ncbi:NAD(P)/FAD-dependent oxidoreductase [Brachybacterium sp. ACRRE]|uniref:NAD(P)/FAD-dependent oxidoreductase n=1 Tax=Brachybacterium sp. ACRRE TaxID=2918184 RepID=UPI001EF2AF76|nr:FAD-dependent oxidoreductase [Brachybacterium sp. ACRRE]MCG7309613.1 FAD-dependent oxidoreductase [Brachybacterium sp. ACRRE]
MTSYDYLIIGGGQVSDDAARGVREKDRDGSIGILSDDVDAPYTRPALTKKLWTDPEFTEAQVPLGTAEATGATVRLGVRVTAVDPSGREVVTADGEHIGYGRLLLATGSEPQGLPGDEDEDVIVFRSFADYRALRRRAQPGARAVVVGGGYIGSELAAALVQNDVEVTLCYPQEVLGGEQFPTRIARRHQQLFEDAGVHLMPGRRVDETRRRADGALEAVLDDGTALTADVIVVGLGATPRVDLAARAGLEVREGVVVDTRLRTSDPSIWAAGDIAEYPDAILGRTRIEHVDHARASGDAAGRSMAGDDAPYDHTPYFYSAILGTSWEAIGSVRAELRTHEVDLDAQRMVVYYLDEQKRPVGVLLWNVEGARDRARQVLADAPTDPEQLDGRIR